MLPGRLGSTAAQGVRAALHDQAARPRPGYLLRLIAAYCGLLRLVASLYRDQATRSRPGGGWAAGAAMDKRAQVARARKRGQVRSRARARAECAAMGFRKRRAGPGQAGPGRAGPG